MKCPNCGDDCDYVVSVPRDCCLTRSFWKKYHGEEYPSPAPMVNVCGNYQRGIHTCPNTFFGWPLYFPPHPNYDGHLGVTETDYEFKPGEYTSSEYTDIMSKLKRRGFFK
jgi:hypothetical protein